MMEAVCVHHILCVGCAVLLWCNTCDGVGVCSSYIVCGVSCAVFFLCSIYVKVAARVVLYMVARWRRVY